jgi:hypothetical protein
LRWTEPTAPLPIKVFFHSATLSRLMLSLGQRHGHFLSTLSTSNTPMCPLAPAIPEGGNDQPHEKYRSSVDRWHTLKYEP